MSPHEFIRKWRASELKERSASQEHFIDLCRLLGEPTPAEADPTGETYCFERGALKDTGGDGWADVWKRHHFAWEYKGRRADLPCWGADRILGFDDPGHGAKAVNRAISSLLCLFFRASSQGCMLAVRTIVPDRSALRRRRP